MRRFLLALAVGLSVVLVAPGSAQAHVERPSYWPEPTADCSVTPCAGGKVPTIRSLSSALNTDLPGKTRVVCKSNSLTLLKASIASAKKYGYYIRPTDRRTFSDAQATTLLNLNTKLFKLCAYREIQPAISASRNNDRVVVMPGLYLEPTSRAKPAFDPSCDKYETKSDKGDPGALSHEYQLNCPNDANLVAVIGRDAGAGVAGDPETPLVDRHGVPNAGKCIRCNVQLEGSGVKANDVTLEAGDASAGNGGPSAAGHKKDVGIFIDRADGFVLRNIAVRHAREHNIYLLETDGYVLDRFKVYYGGAYGVLTFVGDHGVMQNCEATGSGDSGLYPGSGAPTLLENRDKEFYPVSRYSQTVRLCDSHRNTSGFSGTNSHGTHVVNNNFYNNALGYTTDVFTAAGHPGFPQDGNVVEANVFYNNNFNPFTPDSDVAPFIPAPVGTGLWLAGGNANVVKGNRFYDNWRRGVMLFSVPDATVCGPIIGDTETPIPGCNPLSISTSYDNSFYGNKMGVTKSGVVKPNGQDFWWDSFLGNTGNCWWKNTAAPGKSVTSNTMLPNCSDGTAPGTSVGTTDVVAEAELVACLAGMQVSGYPHGEDTICSWAVTPDKPGAASTRTAADAEATAARQQDTFEELCATGGAGARTCAPYRQQFNGLSLLTMALEPLTSTFSLATPAPKSTKPLSLYTCSWWNQAGASQRLELVQRLRHFAGGSVDDGNQRVGYGSVMKDNAANQLFNGRCSSGYAGAFALYKVYGAAAAFAGTAG